MVKVVVYGRVVCPYCERAQDLLKGLNIPFTYVDMTGDPDLHEQVFARANGARTVPQIFIDGHPVGGYSELVSLHEKGELLNLCLNKE